MALYISPLQEDIKKKYSKIYKNVKYPINFCYDKEKIKGFKINPYQKFITTYFKEYPGRRGLLLYHQLGSGKTLSSILWLKYFILELQKYSRFYIIASNILIDNYVREMKKFLSNKEFKILKSKMISINYITLKNTKILNNSLIVMDESHVFIFNVIKQNKKSIELWNSIYKAKNIKILALSATPLVYNPFEIAALFNMLSGKPLFPRNGLEFSTLYCNPIDKEPWRKKRIKKLMDGYVSYYSGVLNDINIAPKNLGIKVMHIVMSKFQKSKIDETSKKDLKLKYNLFVPLKSNIKLNKNILNKHSTKMYSVIDSIIKNDINEIGNIFIFTRYESAIPTLIQYLKFFNFKEFKKSNMNIRNNKRFIVLTRDNINKYLNSYINSEKNNKGDYAKIIIGTKDIKYGISIFNVRKVHILEAQPHYSDLEQILGRVIRICSHSTLPKKYRTVKYIIWLSKISIYKSSLEQVLFKNSLIYDYMNNKFLKLIKEISIDRFIWNIKGNKKKSIINVFWDFIGTISKQDTLYLY